MFAEIRLPERSSFPRTRESIVLTRVDSHESGNPVVVKPDPRLHGDDGRQGGSMGRAAWNRSLDTKAVKNARFLIFCLH